MGKRGPKPTPTHLLKLRGSWRAETRDGEPKPTPELPEMPEWLTGKGAEHWAEVGAMLDGLGIMARPHTLALAMLCEALAKWIETREARWWTAVLSGCREFGMTPSAITSIRSANPDAEKKSKFPRLSRRAG